MADKKVKVGKSKVPLKIQRQMQQKKWSEEEKEIRELEDRCKNVEPSSVSVFQDFPISHRTIGGLTNAGYKIPTEIQREGIAIALRGCDVLGAAKTGSGKTLAFLVPIMELLWRQKWTSVDGLGALVITPTRELAYQIFEVLCKIGQKHDLSAGLIIGGKDLRNEQEKIQRTNIIICTPGRLLQHMDETPNFECTSLQILVLDEADRLLDMGFASTLNAIIENLPSERQTLLYSATQTRSVRDLARLSLQDPEYVSVHEKAKTSTPTGLKQSYVVCKLPEKINFLYSFIRNHLKAKILVFLSSCKQVKFVYETFRRLRPGIPLMALYGRQKQLKRVAIFNNFCKKTHAVLFATDIAARGLDIPSVHWVIQLDCPEDANTYIHRAGRTARYHKDGQSLLVLLPSEELEMVKALEDKKVPINKISVDPKKLTSIQKKLEAFCAQNQDIKHWAQKSIVSYARSVFLQSNKKVFSVHKLPLNEYALALGLPNAPRIRFMQKAEKKFGSQNEAESTNKQDKLLRMASNLVGEGTSSDENSSDEEVMDDKHSTNRQGVSFIGSGLSDDDNNDDDCGLTLKKKNVAFEDIDSDDEELGHAADKKHNNRVKTKTKVATIKKLLNKKIKFNTKIVFDDDGEVAKVDGIINTQQQDQVVPLEKANLKNQQEHIGGISLLESAQRLQTADREDRKKERKRVKAKHKQERLKLRSKRKEQQGQIAVSLLASEEPENLSESEEDVTRLNDSVPEPKKKKKKYTRESESENEYEEEQTSAGGHLREDEEMALQLLACSS